MWSSRLSTMMAPLNTESSNQGWGDCMAITITQCSITITQNLKVIDYDYSK